MPEAEVWMPGVERNPADIKLWGPIRVTRCGILHSTESRGKFKPHEDDYFGHNGYPHFTASWLIYQHIPINYSCRALRNLSGGVDTNNTGVVQIEVDWNAADMANVPRKILDNVKRIMDWCDATGAVPLVAPYPFHEYPPENGIRLDGREPWRLTNAQWLALRGWGGHQIVPEQVHGDPGLIDIAYLLATEDDVALTPELQAEFDVIKAMIAETDRHATEAVDNTRRLRTEMIGAASDNVPARSNMVGEIHKKVGAADG